jgi:hypothetical protein
MKLFSDDDIKWIKQYRIDNECGLQEAKRVLLRNRIMNRITKQGLTNEPILKAVLLDIMEFMEMAR